MLGFAGGLREYCLQGLSHPIIGFSKHMMSNSCKKSKQSLQPDPTSCGVVCCGAWWRLQKRGETGKPGLKEPQAAGNCQNEHVALRATWLPHFHSHLSISSLVLLALTRRCQYPQNRHHHVPRAHSVQKIHRKVHQFLDSSSVTRYTSPNRCYHLPDRTASLFS